LEKMKGILASLWGKVLMGIAGGAIAIAVVFFFLWFLADRKAEREALRADLLQSANERNLETIEFQRVEIERNGAIELARASQVRDAQGERQAASDGREAIAQDNDDVAAFLNIPVPCALRGMQPSATGPDCIARDIEPDSSAESDGD
jgi:hypothetical protein